MSSVNKIEKKIFRHVLKGITTYQNQASMYDLINFTRHSNRNLAPVLNLEEKVQLAVSHMKDKFYVQQQGDEFSLTPALQQQQHQQQQQKTETPKSVSFSMKRPRLQKGPKVSSLRMFFFGNNNEETVDNDYVEEDYSDDDEYYSDEVPSEPEEKKRKVEESEEHVNTLETNDKAEGTEEGEQEAIEAEQVEVQEQSTN